MLLRLKISKMNSNIIIKLWQHIFSMFFISLKNNFEITIKAHQLFWFTTNHAWFIPLYLAIIGFEDINFSFESWLQSFIFDKMISLNLKCLNRLSEASIYHIIRILKTSYKNLTCWMFEPVKDLPRGICFTTRINVIYLRHAQQRYTT